MSDAERLHHLRELFLTSGMPMSTRIVTVAVCILLAGVVLWLVRRRKLREEYTPIWLAVVLAVFVITVRLDVLYGLTRAIGAWTPSSTIFFVGELFLVLLCLNYAVRLSSMSGQVKNLAQEVALLRARLEERSR